MGMKPRLNDGPAQFEGLVNQPKAVGENVPLSDSTLATKSGSYTPPSNLATCPSLVGGSKE